MAKWPWKLKDLLFPPPEREDRKGEYLRAIDRARNVSLLPATAGWRIFQSDVEEWYNSLLLNLTTAPGGEVPQLQARIQELGKVLRYVDEVKAHAEFAGKELQMQERWDKEQAG